MAQLSGVSLLKPSKCFLKLLGQSLMIIMIILMLGPIPFYFTHLITLGSSIGVMKWKIKIIFQTSSKNGDYFLALLRTFFALKFLKDMNTLLNMEVIWFLSPVLKFYYSFQDFKFHRFCVRTFPKHNYFHLLFPCN